MRFEIFEKLKVKCFRCEETIYSSILIDFAPLANAVMPVLASSMTPVVFIRFRNASILSGVPVISTVKLSVETSMTRPLKTSTQFMMSERSLGVGDVNFY